MHYPGADNDIRIAYVLADSFKEAEQKVKQRLKKKSEWADPFIIEKQDRLIIV
jgi:hypothetical protein